MADILGVERRDKSKTLTEYEGLKKGIIPDRYNSDAPAKALMLFGTYPHKENGEITNEYSKMYDRSRYQFYLNAPFEISNMCCKVMKKAPIHKYAKETGRVPMTGQMADESRLRTSQWVKKGCNSFDSKNPMSNPMAFWTENDVLQYIVENHLPICSVYGDVVEDYGDEIDGQMDMSDLGWATPEKKYKTTGCKRTGCMLCGFGCHLEKSPNRFEMLKETHPGMYGMLDRVTNSGVTFREAIEWTNEHGNMEIKL